MSDIETAVVDSLKVLDPNWPIREGDIRRGALTCPKSALLLETKINGAFWTLQVEVFGSLLVWVIVIVFRC